jgi:hypothetical protein
MHRVTKPLFVAALAVGMVAGMASVGSASVADSKKSYCKALTNVSDATQAPSDATEIPRETAEDLEEVFSNAADEAPTKALKKATKTVAAYYGAVADADEPGDLSTTITLKYGKALGKVGIYIATKCLSVAIPDITLPGGGKVEIPGLD